MLGYRRRHHGTQHVRYFLAREVTPDLLPGERAAQTDDKWGTRKVTPSELKNALVTHSPPQAVFFLQLSEPANQTPEEVHLLGGKQHS